MASNLKVLHIDASSGFYKVEQFKIGRYFGPIDLGLSLTRKHNSLNIGAGILCNSIFPGSDRLFFTGNSPCWGGFYISSMGGAANVFDNLGINMASIRGKANKPSVLYLNRTHGEEIEVELCPIDIDDVWSRDRKGVYSLMDHVYERFGGRYKEHPRILATGPAARSTDFGAIVSVPVRKDGLSFVDTWAGRGGFGSKLFREHGIAAVIYGGTYVFEDFRDRKVANEWFQNRYQKKMAAKDMESTTKYRFDDELNTGGTFGVNYTKVGGALIAFNYKSIYLSEEQRIAMHKELVADHYLKQFNEELTSQPKNKAMKNCGEPCVALCKKMFGKYKKDYEPYQTMGPLCGVFDQRSAEKLNHHADTLGFDGISIGGVLSWLMECMNEGILTQEDLGVSGKPAFTLEGFKVKTDSEHNADLGVDLMDAIIEKRGVLDLENGPRRMGRALAKIKGTRLLDRLVYSANDRDGWMVPNQYWNAGVLSPMPIMGKYYMHYGSSFVPPRELGRKNAERMIKEIMIDNAGFCRFHRGWVEEMIPDIIESLFGVGAEFKRGAKITSSLINSRNSSVFWKTERNIDFIHSFLVRCHEVAGDDSEELLAWIKRFEEDKNEAALDFWFEIRKGIHERLKTTF